MGLIALLKTGGVSMYPLLICSIAVWAIIFEKYWTLFRFKREFSRLFDRGTELMKQKKVEEVRGLFRSASNVVSAPVLSLLEEDIQLEVKKGRVKRRLIESQNELKQFMWVLGTVGASAPFIGLFGTVLGIIRSFDAIAKSGKSGFGVVAAGLSEALIATAAGIIIAVIAVVFYNYFNSKINNLNMAYRHRLEDLADHKEY